MPQNLRKTLFPALLAAVLVTVLQVAGVRPAHAVGIDTALGTLVVTDQSTSDLNTAGVKEYTHPGPAPTVIPNALPTLRAWTTSAIILHFNSATGFNPAVSGTFNSTSSYKVQFHLTGTPGPISIFVRRRGVLRICGNGNSTIAHANVSAVSTTGSSATLTNLSALLTPSLAAQGSAVTTPWNQQVNWTQPFNQVSTYTLQSINNGINGGNVELDLTWGNSTDANGTGIQAGVLMGPSVSSMAPCLQYPSNFPFVNNTNPLDGLDVIIAVASTKVGVTEVLTGSPPNIAGSPCTYTIVGSVLGDSTNYHVNAHFVQPGNVEFPTPFNATTTITDGRGVWVINTQGPCGAANAYITVVNDPGLRKDDPRYLKFAGAKIPSELAAKYPNERAIAIDTSAVEKHDTELPAGSTGTFAALMAICLAGGVWVMRKRLFTEMGGPTA